MRTGMHPTNRLFGAGMEPRNGLRKGTPPCQSKPACAAAHETGSSGFRNPPVDFTTRRKGVDR
jgi:hypothetical protein